VGAPLRSFGQQSLQHSKKEAPARAGLKDNCQQQTS
jgi:hypothetical protein